MQKAIDSQYWACSVNGETTLPILFTPIAKSATVKICAGSSSGDTEAIFSFYFIKSFESGTADVLLDYLEYLPNPSSSPEVYRYIAVSFDDPAMLYIPRTGWSNLLYNGIGDSATFTFMNDSSVEYNFTGKQYIFLLVIDQKLTFCPGASVTWVGFAGSSSDNPATISYTIDDKFSATAQVPVGISSDYTPHQILFQSPSLAFTNAHCMKAEFKVNSANSTTPFSLQYLIIENGTVPASMSLPIPPLSSTTEPHDTVHASKHTSHVIGPLIAGVISAAIINATVIYFIVRRRNSKRKKNRYSSPSPIQPFPFPSDLSTGVQRVPQNSTLAVRCRRRLLPPARGMLVVPPAKLRGDNPRQEPVVPRTPAPISGSVEVIAGASQQLTRTGALDIQEQDSGLRNVEDLSTEDEVVRALPPAYTVT